MSADAEPSNPSGMDSWLPSLERCAWTLGSAFDFVLIGRADDSRPVSGRRRRKWWRRRRSRARRRPPIQAFRSRSCSCRIYFLPSLYDASGYSNTFIVQPVIPFNIGEDAFFPYHIIRPTLPVIAPTADPDGPRGVQGGLGDTTIVDVFIHPSEELKTNFGIGYVANLPTRTHPALGEGEMGSRSFSSW